MPCTHRRAIQRQDRRPHTPATTFAPEYAGTGLRLDSRRLLAFPKRRVSMACAPLHSYFTPFRSPLPWVKRAPATRDESTPLRAMYRGVIIRPYGRRLSSIKPTLTDGG